MIEQRSEKCEKKYKAEEASHEPVPVSQARVSGWLTPDLRDCHALGVSAMASPVSAAHKDFESPTEVSNGAEDSRARLG